MGSSAWSSDAYSNLKASYTTKSVDDIFTNNRTRTISNDMTPNGVKFRESRDSDTHPETLAIGIFLDVTGSMGKIPEIIVREKLGNLMETLLKHDIKGPQVLFGAIGDHYSDSYPLQIGQFEAGTEELNKWLQETYLEGGGGGQNKESYLLSWLIAGRHTSIDCFEKRGNKGVLFTIGDESNWSKLESGKLKDLMGYTQSDELTDKELLAEAQRLYHVYHIHVNQGSYQNDPDVLGYWKSMLGERLIVLEDYNDIAELIATTVAVIHGVDIDKVTSGFSDSTANNVKNALMKVDTSIMKSTSDSGVMKL